MKISAVLTILLYLLIHPLSWAREGTLVVAKEKSFQQLMDESMSKMHREMASAHKSKDPDYDFVKMMIPHHQGAIDMARILLLYGKDSELRNLALQIITEQQNEINIMKAWLQNYK